MEVGAEASKKDQEKADTADRDVRKECNWNEKVKLNICFVFFAQTV
jgi:hypothetical protein